MKTKDFGALLVMFMIVLSVTGTVSAVEVLVETDTSIIGIAVVDRELYVQTDPGYDGIKFYDNFWTPGLGIHGLSNISLDESVRLLVCNVSVLDVVGSVDGEKVKFDSCLRNYDIGSRQSNMYVGNSINDFEWSASNESSVMIFAGDFSGKQRSTTLVRNMTNPHYKVYDEDLWTKGNISLDLSSVIMRCVRVGKEGDWLGCP